MKQEKQKKRKKRRKKHYILRLFIILLIGTGIYFLLTSETFDVDVFIVEGNSYYTDQQIISLSEVKQSQSGLNLFRISTKSMKENLLVDPYIKTVSVIRRIPNEINIAVTERTEAAAIPYGSKYILIDNEGIVLRQTDAEPSVTVLEGLTLSNIEPGTPLSVEENLMLSDTLKLLEAMNVNELFFKKIEVSTVVVKAYIYDNLTCEGTPESIMKSMDGLTEVLYDLFIQGIERGVIKVGGDGYYSFSPLVE